MSLHPKISRVMMMSGLDIRPPNRLQCMFILLIQPHHANFFKSDDGGVVISMVLRLMAACETPGQ